MLIIIDNYDSFTYNLYQKVVSKIETQVFRNDKITIAEIKKMNPSGIILSPGPGHPVDSGICLSAIEELAPHIPILGICLGHQAIGCAFGGRVIQHHEIVHGKARMIHHMNDDLFKNVPSSFSAGRYHSLIIDLKTLPADLIITAISDDNSIMAVKHAIYPCYGVQFHPESILTSQGELILNNFIDICNNIKFGKKHVERFNLQAYAA